MYTREEFENMLVDSAKSMASDSKLREKVIDIFVEAGGYSWVHQTKWFGEPLLNLPQDMFAVQEIIYETKPKYFIEIGTAWGGGLLFYSTLMEVLGGEKVIGVDIYIPDDLRERINQHGKLSERIEWINGSSVAANTVSKIKEIIGDSREVMILLDSNHTHEHVLKELQIYSKFVGKGFYLVCCDTIVEYRPKNTASIRPWGPGDNPKTALDEFMDQTDRFEIDRLLDNKLLFSCNPGGYLKAVKD